MTLFLITLLLGFALSYGANPFLHLHGGGYPQGPSIRQGNIWNNDNKFWRLGDGQMSRNIPAFNRNFDNRAFRTGLDWSASPTSSYQSYQTTSPSPRIKPVFEMVGETNNFYNWPFTTMRPSTSTAAIPGMETTRTSCENSCSATNQFDPVCGNNGVTYTNMQWYKCALRCGRSVKIRYRGACPRPI